MSGGASGISGYVYQKDYAAFRLLSSEAIRLLDNESASGCIDSFCVEGSATSDGTVWDVTWILANGQVHFRECKDTEIKSLDRIQFYRRVRKTIGAGIDPTRLTIGWVTDPEKQDGILKHWTGMRGLAAQANHNQSSTPPQRVDSALKSLQEAIYYLCTEADYDAGAPPLTMNQASAILARMAVDCYRAADLALAVGDLANSLFERGLGSAIRQFIQGLFDTVIQTQREARYSRNEFLQLINSGQLALTLADSFRTIIRFHSALCQVPIVSGIVWAHFTKQVKNSRIWTLQERIPSFDHTVSCVLIASMGIGKSTFAQQAFCIEAGRRSSIHTLCLDAGDTTAETISALPMLCLLLCGAAPTWIAIDGLDQVARSDLPAWKEAMIRLQRIQNLTLLLTVRAEVVGNNEWIQRLIASIGEVQLKPLSDTQIDDAFIEMNLTAPSNQALRLCLRNSFLFSVYARTIKPDDMPLTNSGEVEAFSVINEFWKRNVVSESSGLRLAGEENSSHVLKCAAISYAVGETLAGRDIIQIDYGRTDLAQGIAMLCNEGVLVRNNTTTAVKWAHAWFREYAIVDHLLGELTTQTPQAMAEAVCGVSVDHVARDAANGCCKWLIANSSSSAVGKYLETIYASRKGLASEVLFDLVDGNPQHLALNSLSPRLLIETIELATLRGAWQWQAQIDTLPSSKFATSHGLELQRAVIDYETKVPSNA